MPIVMPRAASNARRSNERYPCENCRCGCFSAEQCWMSCCCHTLEQRLAWAKANHVTPPSWLNSLPTRTGKQSLPTNSVASCTTDVKVGQRKCCQSNPSQSCDHCSKQSKCHKQVTQRCCRQESNRSVCLIQSLKCRGLSMFVTFAALGLIPERPAVFVTCESQDRVLLLPRSHYQPPSPELVTPPPQSSSRPTI